MAPRTTVTADTLMSLGAQRLAGILLDLADEQPTIKRRLRLELAGQAGGEAIAVEISKRLGPVDGHREAMTAAARWMEAA
jgi:hypothetical protein